MEKYRILVITDGLGREEYWPQVYKRLWYAPWKFAWVNAYTWESSFPGVPYFSDLGRARKWLKLQITPEKIEEIYPENLGDNK